MDDISLMRRALRLASKARGMTSPNPMVGAVIVKDGKVIAEAFHQRAGEPHAEALAIAQAGDAARGATLYVTLEPCCHTKKRTPPCTNAIISSGISRVFIAMEDPNPQVAGKGVKQLEAAGIEVTCCFLGSEARTLNEAFVKHITTGRPFVTLKSAMTLDGKLATASGESKWITGPKSRAIVHRMRAESDAIITAIGTVKADDPEMTARGRGRLFMAKGGPLGPKRVILDPRLEISESNRIVSSPPETIIVTSRHDGPKRRRLVERGVRMLDFDGRLSMVWLMEELGRMSVTSALIEGGGSLNWHSLKEGVVDKVAFFVAPKILGGKDAVPAVGGEGIGKLAEAFRLRDLKARRVGEDILIEGYVVHEGAG